VDAGGPTTNRPSPTARHQSLITIPHPPTGQRADLPIWDIHDGILSALRGSNRLVLAAPTGSGKTTQVPQMLLDAGLARGKKIVVLQPRRVAARTVAARVAWERKVKLGAEVGYQVRFDDTTSPGTVISFVTEGILLRWLQDDPKLGSIGAVLFDEFHERNLLSDASLALVKRLQETARPDLLLAVMSATLEVEPLAKYLENKTTTATASGPSGKCPVLVSEGQMFPVEVRYAAYQDDQSVIERAAAAVERIIREGEAGDILVFMPGMGEINATIQAIQSARLGEPVAIIPLHGDLQPEEQDRAFGPSERRKIVVATNVAETSVTIDGIRHVVDGGLARIARYDPERGINTLHLEEISRASAEQRKGRAGRTAPGVCHRLWTESGQKNRPERNTPEIQRADLAEVVLLLHSMGIRRAAEFDWLDRPDTDAVARAENLLRSLGALRAEAGGSPEMSGEAGSDITPLGRQMLRLPMHPRYARMLLEAARGDCLPAAALCAALVSGRDLLTRLGRDDAHVKEARELFEGSESSDFHTLTRAFHFARNNGYNVERCRRYGIHAATARLVDQTWRQILEVARRQRLVAEETEGFLPQISQMATDEGRRLGAQEAETRERRAPASDEPLHRAILAGFIDQVCARRNLGSLDCDMTEGREGKLMRESVVQNAPLFVAALVKEVTMRDSGKTTLLGLATAVKKEWITELAPGQCLEKLEHLYDRTHKRVAAVLTRKFHGLVIHHQHQAETDPEAAGLCLAEAHLRHEFELPLLNHEARQFIARTNLAARILPELEFPRLDPTGLRQVLSAAFRGLTLARQAQAAPLREFFHRFLGPDHLAALNESVPTQINWPENKKVKLVYPEETEADGGEEPGPEAQVKLTECFALKEHPRVCEGRAPVRLASTVNWPVFRTNQYAKARGTLMKKFPGNIWPS
jgi:ATP-dependent helicase HrpB